MKKTIIIGVLVPLTFLLAGFVYVTTQANSKVTKIEINTENEEKENVVILKNQYELNPTFSFINEEGDIVSKKISITSKKPIASYLNHIIETYANQKDSSIITIPKETRFIDYKIEMGILYINVNEAFKSSTFLDTLVLNNFYEQMAISLRDVPVNDEFIDFQIIIEGEIDEDIFNLGYSTENPLRIPN